MQCSWFQTWEAYVTELPKLPWTNIYLTSFELEDYGELEDRILYAIYYGPCGLKCKDPSAVEIDSQVEVQCPEKVCAVLLVSNLAKRGKRT